MPKSPCAKLARQSCLSPTCKWAGGQKRQFCRVSTNTSSRNSSPSSSKASSPTRKTSGKKKIHPGPVSKHSKGAARKGSKKPKPLYKNGPVLEELDDLPPIQFVTEMDDTMRRRRRR